ncbi:MAG TPA: response regulator transcription factor [Candidatus Nanopelagicales bacterium]|nr:response regulator transcription factor [Candidatus Nanopelagicales bacterium]
MSRVLVAEDDPGISEPLLRALGREGYDVTHVTDGPAALDAAMSGRADLLVLDLGLPGMDGLDVCRTLRGRGSTLPVLVLTARTDEPDLVVGLDAGADDYVGKPFRLAELMARIRAQLRRASGPEHELVQAAGITVDASSRRVTVEGEEIALTPKEYDLLLVLIRRAGLVVPRDELMREVWQTEWFGATKTLDMHISTLRRKLGDAGSCISTVRGVGFRLEKDS